MLFYKVVEIRHKSFVGVMTSLNLQNTINKWANIGWELDRITSAEMQGFLHGKDALLLIFKRDVEIPNGLHILLKQQSLAVTKFNLLDLIIENKIALTTPAIVQGMNEWETFAKVAPELAEMIFVEPK